MQCSDIDKALLVVAETVSKNVYPKDRSVAAMFGDAGSAILLEKNESSSIQGLLRTDGKRYRAIIMPAGGSRNPFPSSEPMLWPDGNERTLFNNYMNGMDVFNFTITEVPLAIKDFLSHTHTDVSDYDSFVLHQANLFISKQIARKLRIPTEKMPISLDRFGNTSAPSIPLTLCDAYCNSTEGVLRTLMCGYGVGLSWGVVSAPIDTEDILPVFDTDEYFAEGLINSPEDL